MTAGALAGICLVSCALAIEMTAHGDENHAFPPEIAAWTDARKAAQRDAATRLLAQIRAAVEKGRREFRIAPGHYRFGKVGPKRFELRGVEDFHIDATGVTFWFEGRFRIDSVFVHGCTNVSIKGLTVDYDPLPYAQGQIIRMDKPNETLDIHIDPGFPLPDPTWTREVGKIKAVFYGRDRRQTEVRMDWIKSLERIEGRTYRVGFKSGWIFKPEYKSDIRPGDWLCLPDRSMRHTFVNADSERITLEDITIHACPHMALTETGGAGGHVYRRCRVVRRPGTRRLLACNADVFHSVVVARGPLIEDCEFSHAADDFVNIHGFFFMVYEQRSPTQVVTVNQYSDTCFAVGSQLGFYRFEDLAPLGEAKAVRMTRIESKETFEAVKRMPSELQEQGHRIRDFHPRNIYPFLVELNRPVKVRKYDLVGCADRAGDGAIIRNNHFHDVFTRGVLLKCSNAVVEGNTIERAGDASIAVAAERFWMEGPFAHDVLIKNNTIVDSGAMFLSHNWNTTKLGAISVVSQAHVGLTEGMHHERIRIVGNRITRPAACGIAVMNARDCAVEDNTIEKPFSKEPTRFGSGLRVKDPLYAIYVAAAEHVTIKGNRVTGATAPCKGDVGLGPRVNTATIRVERR